MKGNSSLLHQFWYLTTLQLITQASLQLFPQLKDNDEIEPAEVPTSKNGQVGITKKCHTRCKNYIKAQKHSRALMFRRRKMGLTA